MVKYGEAIKYVGSIFIPAKCLSFYNVSRFCDIRNVVLTTTVHICGPSKDRSICFTGRRACHSASRNTVSNIVTKNIIVSLGLKSATSGCHFQLVSKLPDDKTKCYVRQNPLMLLIHETLFHSNQQAKSLHHF